MNKRNDMHHLVFTQEVENDTSRLVVYQTDENQLFISIAPSDDDPYRYESITLKIDDAKALANEITRIARSMADDSNIT